MTRVLSFLLTTLLAAPAFSQSSYPPPNEAPNPYLPGVSWGQLPDGRRWGSTAGVDVAPDGSVWAYDRCGGNQNGCVGSKLTAVLHFDTSGKLLHQFGADMFNFPHGLHVDHEGNVWVTDHGTTPPNGRGQVVYKFDPQGKVLMTLGRLGVAGDGPDAFNQPSDVLVAPNGDIFVADGHAPGPAARIVKFDRTGKFIKSWGSLGAAADQLNGPHALAMDSQGRLYVGDRSNNRVQVFDQEGTLLASWKQFGRPSGIFIDRNDMMYVTDSESRSDNKPGQYGYNPGVNRGIRIGSVKDGKVVAFIPDPAPMGISSTSEGVAVDRTGAVYGAEVVPRDMKKYVKAPPSTTAIAATGGDITITAIMHGSVQVEHAARVIHVDPAMGDLEKAKDADLILITDVHDDHMNPSGIAHVRKASSAIVAPKAVATALAERIQPPVEVLANGQTRTIAGVTIEAVPMYNVQRKVGNEPFHEKGRGNGYVVTIGGKRLYFAGDTECVPEIKALKNIDVAFLPMNLPFTMPPVEAAECAKAFKPRVVIPYHFQGQRFDAFVTAMAGTGIDVRELNWYPTVFRPDVIAMAAPGRLVNVGGHRVHLHCTGNGSPTVVLQGSPMTFAIDWHRVQPAIAKSTRVCSFDYPGFGWSEPLSTPETNDALVASARNALIAAGEKPPYVLVSSGVGSMLSRMFQLTHPTETSGFVFVEPVHEDGFLVPVKGKPAPIWSFSAEALAAFAKTVLPPADAPSPPAPAPSTGAPFDTLPPEVLTTRVTFQTRAARRPRLSRDQELARIEDDRMSAVRLHQASAAGPPFGQRPTIVLLAEYGDEPMFKAVQSKVTALSTNSAQRTVPKSGREIYLYDPSAVVRAISDVLTAVRTNGKVSP